MLTRFKCLNCNTTLVREEVGSPLIMKRSEAVRASGFSDNKFRKRIQPFIKWRKVGGELTCELTEFLAWYRSLPVENPRRRPRIK